MAKFGKGGNSLSGPRMASSDGTVEANHAVMPRSLFTVAVVASMFGILLYVWFRFEWQFAVAAVLNKDLALASLT